MVYCKVGLIVAADGVLLLFAWIVVNSVDFRSSFFVCFGMCLLIVVLGMLGLTICMGYLFATTYYVVVCGWLLVCVGFVICCVAVLNAVVVDCCLDLCLLRFGYSCLLVAGLGYAVGVLVAVRFV